MACPRDAELDVEAVMRESEHQSLRNAHARYQGHLPERDCEEKSWRRSAIIAFALGTVILVIAILTLNWR